MHSPTSFPNNLIRFRSVYYSSPELLGPSSDPQPLAEAISDSSDPPDIDRLKDTLHNLPEKKRANKDGLPREGTRKRIIFELHFALQAAKAKGHTYEDLANLLRDRGFPMLSAECLRKYYKEAAAYFEHQSEQPNVQPQPVMAPEDEPILRRITKPSPMSKADESEFLNLD